MTTTTTTKTTTTRTKEDKRKWSIDKKKALGEALDSFLEAQFTDPDKIKNLVDHYRIANLYDYSMTNTALIMAQGGTLAQSYKKWQKLGRYVKKGERGQIYIYVPLMVSDKRKKEMRAEMAETSDPAKRLELGSKIQRNRPFFVLKPVFDVAQTDGEPLKYEHDNADLLNIPYADVKDKLKGLVKQQIIEAFSGTSRGSCGADTITVNPSSNNTDKVKTLIHEVAHAILHHRGEEFNTTSRGGREVEAESVAHLVMSYLGHPLELSAGYVQNWQQQGDDYDKIKILTTAEKIIKALK